MKFSSTFFIVFVALCSSCRNRHSPALKPHDTTSPIIKKEVPHAIYHDTLFDSGGCCCFPLLSTTRYDYELAATDQFRYWRERERQIKTWIRKYKWLHLPDKAIVIDEKQINYRGRQRTLVAWMENWDVHINPDNQYTCPDVTAGKGYLRGKLSISLVDEQKKKLINTISVREHNEWNKGRDTIVYDQSGEYIEYPFSIANPKSRSEMGGLVYFAKGGTDTTEARADMLRFVDFNNDGKALEFAFFKQWSCVGKASTLLAYNPITDSLEWLEWHLDHIDDVNGNDSSYSETTHWMGHAMIFKFQKNGILNYEMDYRGRGGELIRFYLRYDKATNRYSGRVDSRDLPEDSARTVSWMSYPQWRD